MLNRFCRTITECNLFRQIPASNINTRTSTFRHPEDTENCIQKAGALTAFDESAAIGKLVEQCREETLCIGIGPAELFHRRFRNQRLQECIGDEHQRVIRVQLQCTSNTAAHGCHAQHITDTELLVNALDDVLGVLFDIQSAIHPEDVVHDTLRRFSFLLYCGRSRIQCDLVQCLIDRLQLRHRLLVRFTCNFQHRFGKCIDRLNCSTLVRDHVRCHIHQLAVLTKRQTNVGLRIGVLVLYDRIGCRTDCTNGSTRTVIGTGFLRFGDLDVYVGRRTRILGLFPVSLFVEPGHVETTEQVVI